MLFKRRKGNSTWRGKLLAALVIAGLWQVLVWSVDGINLPSSWQVIQAMTEPGDELWQHGLISARRILISLFVALVLGVPAGLYLGRNPRVDQVVAPFIYLTYPIPKIVFLPLIFVLMGLGDASRVLLITLTIFYQILVSARDAARSLPLEAVYSIRSLGGGRWAFYRHVLFPYSLPKVFTALRISIGTASAVLFFAESFATSSGLGYLIMDSWGQFDYEKMIAAIAGMSLLGLLLYSAVEMVESWVSGWSRTTEDR
ncbi:MAG: ABC transporter permease [Firmicutes bacterium]|nr:ABC transporter permease [Bacillota bacterium]